MRAKQILIIKDISNKEIADGLEAGAIAALKPSASLIKTIEVPNMGQIPTVLRFAIRSMELRTGDDKFSGYIALGCLNFPQTQTDTLILGTIYDGLQNLKQNFSLAVGTGICVPNNFEEAKYLSSDNPDNLGIKAAFECLKMLEIKRELGL